MGPRIEVTAAHALILEILPGVTDETLLPVGVFVQEFRLVSLVPQERSRGAVGCHNGIGQDFFHPIVRGEGLAFLYTDGCEEPTQFGIEHADRLTIDDSVEFFEELEVVGVNRVERFSRSVDKFHLRGISRLRKGIDLHACPEKITRKVRLEVNKKSPQDKPVDVTGGLRDEVILGNVTLVIRWKNQIFAPLALVGARRTHIDYKAKVGIVHCSRADSRWNLNHRRAVLLEIENNAQVDRTRIACQEQWIAVHKLIEYQGLVGVFQAEAFHPESDPLQRGCRNTV